MKYIKQAERVWKDVTLIFIISRLWVVGVAGFVILFQLSPYDLRKMPSEVAHNYLSYDFWTYFLAGWRWDAVHILDLVAHGYQYKPGNPYLTAFLPLWPMLVRGLGDVIHFFFPSIGGVPDAAYYLASMILTNLFLYATMYLLYRLVEKDAGSKVARLVVLYLAIYPYTLFLFSAYTEALFLLLCVATFYALQRGWSWLAVICAMLVMITRVAGALIIIPFVVIYINQFWPDWRQRIFPWWSMFIQALPIAIIPVGLVLYLGYLYLTWGNPLIFHVAEETKWNRHTIFPGGGLFATIVRLVTYNNLSFEVIYTNLLDLLFTFGAIIVFMIKWRSLPLHYRWFTLAMLLFTISTWADAANPARAYPRFIMTIFPLFILYAQWVKSRFVQVLTILLFLAILTINIIFFVSGRWVA